MKKETNLRLFSLLLLFNIAFSLNASEHTETPEEQFWELIADFDENLFYKDFAGKDLQELSYLINKFDDATAKTALLLRKIKYLKVHSTSQELDEFLSQSFALIPERHFHYLGIYTDYVWLQSSLDKSSRVESMRRQLEEVSIDGVDSFKLALNLLLSKDTLDYEVLETHCSNECNFSLYHLSIMEYYKRNEDIERLKSYAGDLFRSYIKKELFISDAFFVNYLLAYLSVINQDDKDASAFFREESFKYVSKGSFVYLRLHEILKQ